MIKCAGPSLQVDNPQGTITYFFGETPDGGPRARGYWTGKVEDAAMGLVIDYLLAKGIGKIAESAYDAWRAYRLAQAAERAVQLCNRLYHIFGKAEHNLGNHVRQFGSRESAFNAIQQATETAIKNRGLQGVFETTVKVGTETITVRGAVVDGVVKIGTAFKP